MQKEEFSSQLKQLVKIDSVTGDNTGCGKVISWVENNLGPGVITQKYSVDGVQTIVCGNGNIYTPDIAYIVHADVVEPTRDNHFDLKIIGDRMMGRGASDMKYAIPIGMQLLNDVVKSRLPLNFALIVSTDEETGGHRGVKMLVKEGKISPRCVVVPDAGDDFTFIERTKGLVSVKVEIGGTAAHASQPWEGHSANHDGCLFGAKLVQNFGPVYEKNTWSTTLNIGRISGGKSTNQVCSHAEMNLDIRFPETTSAGEIMEEIQGLAGEFGSGIAISLLGSIPPGIVNMDHPTVQIFLDAFSKYVPKGVSIGRSCGITDARHFMGKSIPVLMIKPWGGEAHGDGEWISYEGCRVFYLAMKDFLQNMVCK